MKQKLCMRKQKMKMKSHQEQMRRQPEACRKNPQLYPRKRTNYICTGYTNPYAQLYTHMKTHVHKALQKQSEKRQNPSRKVDKGYTHTQFTAKEIPRTLKCIIRRLTSFIIRELPIKTPRNHFLTYQVGKKPKI